MKILSINSSSNRDASTSTAFANKVVDRILSLNPDADSKNRHTTYPNLPFIDQDMLGLLFKEGRTEEDEQVLSVSNELTNEVIEADVLVISLPIYNFNVPASLKAYFDLISRAGLTFKYTEQGPVGLLENKKAIVVVSSGGTEINSDYDYAATYVKHFLGFLGITDVEMIKLDQLMFKSEEKTEAAEAKILSLNI